MERAVARWHLEQTRNAVGSPYVRQFGFGHMRSDLAMAATCFLADHRVEIGTGLLGQDRTCNLPLVLSYPKDG
jgi:hypothetical protein